MFTNRGNFFSLIGFFNTCLFVTTEKKTSPCFIIKNRVCTQKKSFYNSLDYKNDQNAWYQITICCFCYYSFNIMGFDKNALSCRSI